MTGCTKSRGEDVCWTLLHADCLVAMQQMSPDSMDGIVTDPPYGLGFLGEEWDSFAKKHTGVPHAADQDAVRCVCGRDVSSARRLPTRHKASLALQSEATRWAQAMLRVAKPGAHLLVFGGARTFHRLACALEDAGWEIRDTLVWLYSDKRPKSQNLTGAWVGWGTALKPAFEPIILARKPLVGTVAANVETYGVGALNIDGCRTPVPAQPASPGRWPANVLLDGDAGDQLDAQFGSRKSGVMRGGQQRRRSRGDGGYNGRMPDTTTRVDTYGDSGGVSRFFYCGRASTREREDGVVGGNMHPTVKPLMLMRYLVRLIVPGGGTVFDPFAGSGTTGVACAAEGRSFLGVEREERFVAVAVQRLQHAFGGTVYSEGV